MNATKRDKLSTPVYERSPLIGTLDGSMIGLMRLILASAALLVIYIDPSEPDRFIAATYTALILYVAYSLFLYLISGNKVSRLRWLHSWAHWLDVIWYTGLIALSSGTGSIFFFFYFFAILVASFRWGFASGLRVTLASSLLFATVGYAASPGHVFELNRSLLRPIYLSVLGYMVAYWGGSELTLKKRLQLLKEVSTLSNPRFGVEQTINLLMKRIRTFYKAKSCLLILSGRAPDTYRLQQCDDRAAEGVRSERLTAEVAQPLLELPPELAVLYNNRRWWTTKATCYAYDVSGNVRVLAGKEASEKLATTLEAESFITVPLQYRNQTIGRLFITSNRCAFHESDLDFLLQAVTQIMPVVENIRLVDRMASDAAREERQTIARDIHDSVIQPYIGLQIGLAGINQKLSKGGFDVKPDVDRLLQGTNAEIEDLRRYIHGLREASQKDGYFISAVHRFAQRFAEMTGIVIEVEAEKDFRIKDRLAAEAFQIVTEALSNVRRHTKSTRIIVNIKQEDDCFVMEIENNVIEAESPAPDFIPKSITGRTEALGGQVRISAGEGMTTVRVEIPL